MKPRMKGGVVDKDLNVHGIQILKVAGIQFQMVFLIVDMTIVVSHV